MTGPMVVVTDLRKTFVTDGNPVNAVDHVSFEVHEGEFFTLLGPSGCGKTTTMRTLAGLERPDDGRIVIDGAVVSAGRGRFVPPEERPIGMVFQSYAIWPHMTVLDNVIFPLAYRTRPRMRRAARREAGMEALRLVQLDQFANRPAPYLSGGQQQRVALARSLVSRPKLLLLDEPLSNLDAQLRDAMRFEIKELVSQLGITTVYVTHDQAEALSMSDRIAVLSQGNVLQVGTPREIYLESGSLDVARFVGNVNTFAGAATVLPDGLCLVRTADGTELIARLVGDLPAGANLSVMVRPELVTVGPPGPVPPDTNVLPGTVQRLLFGGDHIDCYCTTADGIVRAKLPPDNPVAVGDTVGVRFGYRQCVVATDKEGLRGALQGT